MLLQIPEVLTSEQVAGCRKLLETDGWVDGRVTAGHQSARDQRQSATPGRSRARETTRRSLFSRRWKDNPLFMSAALPLKVFPPLFNRYQNGQSFGNHVDNAIRQVTGTPHRVRTDLSATLFFSNPDEYDGGELVVEDTYGVHSVKLPAGHLDSLSGVESSSCSSSHTRRSSRFVLLDTKHGARRWRTHDPFRS